MVRFVHVSDVHLGARNFYLGDKAPARSEEFKATFRDVVEWCLDEKNRVDGLLIAGDLFEHHHPEADLLSFVKGLLSRLLAKDKVVALVPGTHDSYAYKNSVWRSERLPGVEVFLNAQWEAPRVRDIRGTRVFLHGLAFVPGQTAQPLPPPERSRENGIHIGLLHTGLKGQVGYTTRPHHLEVDEAFLATSSFDYWALGGSHVFSETRCGSSLVVNSGALEGRGFEAAECGPKGFVVVDFEANGVHIERRLVSRRTIQQHRLDLRSEKIADATALKNAIHVLSGRDVILELTLAGTVEFVADLHEVREQTQDGFYFLDIVDDSRIVDSALLRKIESENTIRGYFVRKLAARIAAQKAKMAKIQPTPAQIRELRVLDYAMKMGVEQFVEEEAPADSIYSLIPDSDEMVGQGPSTDVGNLEDRVKAMIEYRRRLQNSPPPAPAGTAPNGHDSTNGVTHMETAE